MNFVTRDSNAAPRHGRRDSPRRGRFLRAGLAALVLILIVPAGAAAQGMDFLRGSLGSPTRWDGISMGAQIGLTNMNTDFGNSTGSLVAFSLRNTTVQQEFEPSNWTTLPSTTTNGRSFGAFIGYNVQWDQLVAGFDMAYNRPSTLETSASDSIGRQVTTSDGFVNQVNIVAQSSLKLVDYATMRARAGYAFGQFLPYAVVGGAVGRFNYATTATTTISGNNPVLAPPNNIYGPSTDTESNSKNGALVGGVLAGLGVDVAILPNVFLRGEWEYIAFAPVNGIRANINTGRVGIGMRF
jgi:outer membrane immunogenic protein